MPQQCYCIIPGKHSDTRIPLANGQRPRPLHNPYNIYIYIYISGREIRWGLYPSLFYTYFYNHAHRLRLEKLLRYVKSLLGATTDFLNHFWIQVAVSEVKRPLHGRFGSETAKKLAAIYLTDNIPQRTQVPVRVRV
jgi:hypothetical protein